MSDFMFVPRDIRQCAAHDTAVSVGPRKEVADEADSPSGFGSTNSTDPTQHAAIPAHLQSSQEQHAATYIRELNVENFALISQQRVRLSPGLNVVTGESGAGKSVLVQALNAVLGAPAMENAVRPPADTAVVEGIFQLSPQAQAVASKLLTDLGLPKKAIPASSDASASPLSIRREIRQEGPMLRSRCLVNGAVTSLRVLRELAAAFVDVNGQNSAQTLRDPGMQLQLLDRIAGTSGQAAEFAAQLHQLRLLEDQLAAIDDLGDEDERDTLQALVDEVRALGVEPGEEQRLRAALRRMEARATAVQTCSVVCTSLGADGGVLDGLQSVEATVQSVLTQEEAHSALGGGPDAAHEDGDMLEGVRLMEEAMDILAQARAALTEAEAKVGTYAQLYQFSESEQQETRQRLQTIRRALKQHNCSSTEELIQAAAEAEVSLDTWFRMEGQRETIETDTLRIRSAVVAAAVALSQKRRAAAGHLRAAVESCLGELAMTGSRFDVSISWDASPTNAGLHVSATAAALADEAGDFKYRLHESGLDRVEFRLAAGPAEPMRPLAAVASGGESARIMMALKAAPAAAAAAVHATDSQLSAGATDAVSIPILVLDELDSGVGGRLGLPVAQMLRRMAGQPAASSQILCVSHLPQVAAHAENHLCVRKGQALDGRMLTEVLQLTSDDDRTREVAAMLGLDLPAAQQMVQDASMFGQAAQAVDVRI